MDETLTEAAARAKAAAAAHADTYVAVHPADLAALAAHPKVAATPAGKTFALLARTQLSQAETTGEEPGPVHLHRDKHLGPLLKAAAGE